MRFFVDVDEFLDVLSLLRFADVEFTLVGTDRWYRVPHIPMQEAVLRHRCFDIVHLRPGKCALDPITAVAANMHDRDFCFWLTAADTLQMRSTLATRIFKASIQYGHGHSKKLRRRLLDACELHD